MRDLSETLGLDMEELTREEKARSIGMSNASAALDSGAWRDHGSLDASIAAYAVNVVDTAREYRAHAESALRVYLAEIEADKKAATKRYKKWRRDEERRLR